MVGIMQWLRRSDANSISNVRPATDVPADHRRHRAANSEKEPTRENIFAGGYFRGKIFSREDIFAGRYFRVNSIFAKISSRENISNSLFAKFSSRENKVLYSNIWWLMRSNALLKCSMTTRTYVLKLKCWQYPAIHTNYSCSNCTISN